MLGFIVQSYMAAQLPGCDPTNKPGLSFPPRAGGPSDPLSFSRRSHKDAGGGAMGVGRWAGEADPLLSGKSERDKGGGPGMGVGDLLSSSRRSYSDGAERPTMVDEAGVGVGAGFGTVGGKAAGKNGTGSKDGAR